MITRPRRWTALLSLMAGLLAGGCSDDGGDAQGAAGASGAAGAAGAAGNPGDEYQAEVFASTVVLDEATLAAMSPDDGSGKLRFASSTPQLAGLEKGSVLLTGQSARTPRGLLRVVRSVTAQGGGLELDTLEAPPQLAFRKLHVRTSRAITDVAAGSLVDAPRLPAAVPPGAGPGLRPQDAGGKYVHKDIDLLVFDADDKAETTSDQVRVKGALGSKSLPSNTPG